MKITALLCDYADEVAGKLYIVGGGWSRILADSVAPIALAIKFAIPWEQANQPHNLNIRMVHEDGELFVGPDEKPIEMAGKVEVGRPPGTKAGSELDAALAVRIGPLAFPPGRYVWEISVDGTVLERIAFDAIGG